MMPPLSSLQRTLAVFGSAVLIALLAPLLYRSVAQIGERVAEVEHTQAILQRLGLVRENLVSAESATRAYLITGDALFLTPLEEAGRQARAEVAALQAVTRDSLSRARLGALDTLVDARLSVLGAVVDTRRLRGLPAAIPDIERGRDIMDDVRAVAAELEARQAEMLAGRAASLRTQRRFTAGFAIFAILGASALAFLTNLLLFRHATARERSERALAGANEHLERQAEELETLVQQLQEQAAELEMQAAELEMQAAELEMQSEEQEQQTLALQERTAELDRHADELSASNDRLHFALAAAHMGDWSWDAAARTITLSDGAAALFGFEGGRTIATSELHARLHPEEVTGVRQGAAEALANGCDLVCECRVRDALDGWRWVSLRGRARHRNGDAVGMAGLVQDVTHRHVTERALRQSEERFRRIADSNMVGVFFWTVEGGVTYANDAFLEMIGRSRADIEAKRIDWRAMTPVEWQAADDHAMAEVREHGVSRPFEKEYVHSKGSRVPVLLSAAAFSDDPDRGVTIVMDLTERRRAEQALVEARQRLRLALDSARLGTWELLVDSGASYWDERARAILGVPAVGAISINDALSTIYDADRTRYLDMYRAVVENRRGIFDIEIRVVRPDGAIRWTAWTGLLRRDRSSGRPVKLVGTVEDVTEARAAREMLRTSEERFRIITEAMPQIVWTARADGTVDWYNQRWRDFAGVPRSAAYRDGWRPDLHPEDRSQTALAWRTAIETGGLYEIEHRLRAADGSFRWLLTRGVPLRDEAGDVVRWFGTATEIHDQKEAQAELQAARDEAEAASRAKSQFLAVMSHELRTPLTAIIGYTDLLQTEVLGPLLEPQKKPLTRIRYSAWHLVEIIEEILTFSRVEAGSEPLHFQETDAVDLVRDVLSLMETEATLRGLRLAGDLGRPVVIATDPRKLRQIVLNLVGNAVKFTDQGEVRVSLEQSDGSWVTIRVRDTGPGIPPDQIERIFEPFTQVDQAHTREKGGTGLGLAVSRHLARLLGGDVQVHSAPGNGSTFSVTLPVRQHDEAWLPAGLEQPHMTSAEPDPRLP
jgi:PAS domain S-box-containing protein